MARKHHQQQREVWSRWLVPLSARTAGNALTRGSLAQSRQRAPEWHLHWAPHPSILVRMLSVYGFASVKMDSMQFGLLCII